MSQHTTQHELDVEGSKFAVLRRKTVYEDGQFIIDYSMDNGTSWVSTMADAYNVAKRTGSLTEISRPITEGGEFEAFLLALVEQLGELKPGERLILARTDTQVVTLKESAVLAVRASAIADVDLKMTEGM